MTSLKTVVCHTFSMTDLGILRQFLGLEISQSSSGIKGSHSKYASYMLNKFRMEECNPTKTPLLS